MVWSGRESEGGRWKVGEGASEGALADFQFQMEWMEELIKMTPNKPTETACA